MSASEVESAGRLAPGATVQLLVDAATQLLAEKGPSEIKARTVAERARLSTTAVYYHLGGLPELLQAVVDQAFRNLDVDFGSVAADGDPVAELFSMALASHQVAKRNPHLYDLMFGLSSRGTYRALRTRASQRDSSSEAFQSAYAHFVQACARLCESGRIRQGQEPELIAGQLWSCVHGFNTLELGGHFGQVDDPVGQILQPVTMSVFIALGADPDRAASSYSLARKAYERSHTDS